MNIKDSVAVLFYISFINSVLEFGLAIINQLILHKFTLCWTDLQKRDANELVMCEKR